MRAFSILGDELRLGLADVTLELQPIVEELGFARAGALFVRTFPAHAPYAEQAAARFELVAERMVLQAARREPVPWDAALETLIERAGVDSWTLVGSAVRAVRGVDVAPRDLDLITDAAGCERIGDLLDDLLVEPVVEGGWIGSRWLRAFAEARIECVGDFSGTVVDEGSVAWRGRELRVGRIA